MKTHALYVEVNATSEQVIAEMIEQLARMACDIANSTDDDEASITVWDDDKGEGAHLPIGRDCNHEWAMDSDNVEACTKCGEERGELR